MSGVYATIVCDPPWLQDAGPGFTSGTKSRPLSYATMTTDAIAALPVAEIAERDAHLYLWVTNRYIEHAYTVVRAWRFRPVVLLTWAKAPRGIGLGGTFVQTTEHVLFARRGSCPSLRRVDTTWFQWTRQDAAHSRKPDAFLDLVESVSPAPRLEMFARRQRLGWDTWGNEALEHVDMERVAAPS